MLCWGNSFGGADFAPCARFHSFFHLHRETELTFQYISTRHRSLMAQIQELGLMRQYPGGKYVWMQNLSRYV